jgi:hypothetical protein
MKFLNYLGNLFGKYLPKTLLELPKTSDKSTYKYPSYQCGSSILICGPTYGDKKYFGSFTVDASKLASWTFEHSKAVWSSNKDEQKARELLPLWLSIGNLEREFYVSLLDLPMRHVLVPYLYDFYLKGWVTIYCHECHLHHHELIDNKHDHEQRGDTNKWIQEWLCPNGHVIHHEHAELRWITTKLMR